MYFSFTELVVQNAVSCGLEEVLDICSDVKCLPTQTSAFLHVMFFRGLVVFTVTLHHG